MLPRKLRTKINAILVAYFLFALSVILLTLYVAHQLEGGAAAINDAGSQRMRTYGLAYRLHQAANAQGSNQKAVNEARRLMEEFEVTLGKLERGDPERPLVLPRDKPVQEKMRSLRREWDTNIRPRIERLTTVRDPVERHVLLLEFDAAVDTYVPMVNDLVLMVERINASRTHQMYVFQNLLVAFALIGTLFLIYLFLSLVIRPVELLRAGIERMATSDFGVRLPVSTQDEFGELAKGFNAMADHLQDLYATLEQRVAEKTRRVEEKNRELALLYETTAYLAEPTTLETACKGVLLKLCELLGAPGGVVRLVNVATNELEIVVSSNMSDAFLKAEARLPMGNCLCGEAAVKGVSVTREVPGSAQTEANLSNCTQDCYAAMAAIPIRSKDQVFGIFTLFFRETRAVAPDELRLLEAIGQHLGVAIENLRLVTREKEMAVSEERNLLAQELHDSIAQSLAFLNIQAQMLKESLRTGKLEAASAELALIGKGIQESYDNVRELLVYFRIRRRYGELDEAIRSALEKFEGQTGIRTVFSKQGDAAAPVATSTIQVLHIIQEVLSNVRKHADASEVAVAMRGDGEFSITVRDNGKGFDPEGVMEDDGAHVGISIMRERAHRIGARLELDAAPGRGTCVTLTLRR